MSLKGASAGETWYVGKGLDVGNYYRYNVCQVDYKSCTPFEMDFWVKEKTSQGWNMEVLVKESNKVVKGSMVVGRIAPEPLSFDKDLTPYAAAYKSSIVWLSGFVTLLDPKDFDAPAWGKIGSIGGMQVGPTGVKETITVPAGTFETHVIGWHKSTDNKIWVKEGFPFPIKALTFVDVTAGTIPVQYQLELLEYGQSASPPEFLGEAATAENTGAQCPKDESVFHDVKPLDTHNMIVEFGHIPVSPTSGCTMRWNVEFAKTFDINQFESDVHYDIFVVDENDKVLSSLAGDEGQEFLFTTNGRDLRDMDVKEPPGKAHYVLVVYGTGPKGSAPDLSKAGRLNIDVDIAQPIPEFPLSVIVVMATVITMAVVFGRLRGATPIFKF